MEKELSLFEEKKVCEECGQELSLTCFKKTKWGGYSKICSMCSAQRREAKKQRAIAQARELTLENYTPRELMEELARRGYKGKLTYTRVEEIDITNF